MIKIKHLNKNRIGMKLNDLNITMEQGTLNLVVAKNSGGKSTLLKLIAGSIRNFEGEIELYGKSIEDYKLTDSIGYVPSYMPLNKSTVLVNISTMMEDSFLNWDSELFTSLLSQLHLSLFQNVGELSKGYSKLLMLAIAMAHRPKVYLLDEPTLGLDERHKTLLFTLIEKMLSDGESTIVVASNAIEDFEDISDQLIYIESGSVEYSGNIYDLLEMYHVWTGNESDIPKGRVYGKRSVGSRVELLVDPGTIDSYPGTVKQIVLLLGGKK